MELRFIFGVLILLLSTLIAWWVSPYSERRKEQFRERQRHINTLRQQCLAAMMYVAKSPYEPMYPDPKRAEFYGGPGNRHAGNILGGHQRLMGTLDKTLRFVLPDQYLMWGHTFAGHYEALAKTNSEEEWQATLSACTKSYMQIAGRGGRQTLQRMEIHSDNEAAITGS